MMRVRKTFLLTGFFSFIVLFSFAQSSGSGIHLSNSDTTINISAKNITPDSTSFQKAEGTTSQNIKKVTVNSQPIDKKTSTPLPDSLQPAPVFILEPVPMIKRQIIKCSGG